MPNARISRRRLLRLAAGSAAAVGGAGLASATGTASPPILPRVRIGGLAADGLFPSPPPPPPPPPDTRYDAPEVFYHGDRAVNSIYFTFDDCYNASLVLQIMDIAESAGARVTFFPVGYVMPQNPDLWRSVLARGHAIENHTWDHKALSKLTADQIGYELTTQIGALRQIVGSEYTETFLRPPSGDGIFTYDPRIPQIAASLGLKIAMWSADSNGWRYNPSTDQATINKIIANVMYDFRNGSIVLQHVLSDDVLALPYLLERANQLGLNCITLPAGIR